MKKMYGYARVSTKEQNLDRQIMALTAFGIDDRDISGRRQAARHLTGRPIRHCEINCSGMAIRWSLFHWIVSAVTSCTSNKSLSITEAATFVS